MFFSLGPGRALLYIGYVFLLLSRVFDKRRVVLCGRECVHDSGRELPQDQRRRSRGALVAIIAWLRVCNSGSWLVGFGVFSVGSIQEGKTNEQRKCQCSRV